MANRQVRAIVGARVSHVQGEEKTSHITQRTKGEAYAESQGWHVVGAFDDLDVSAIKLSPWQRPDLAKWLADERSYEWDALIFAKTDRVFRSAKDCVDLARWCEKRQKILVLIDDGIKLDYFHPRDERDAFAAGMSEVFLILASAFAQIEGQRFKQRARDRVAYLRNTDRWGYGIPPFGYRTVAHPSGRGKALAHDVDQQNALHWIAGQMILGESLVGMVNTLNKSGTLSPQDWNRSRNEKPTRGTQWTVEKLREILTRPSTQGIKMAGDKPVLELDGTPVIVGPPSFDSDTWNQLQVAIALRRQAPRERVHSINPQLGVAKCGVCQKNLRQRSQKTPAGKVHRYYVCNNACPGVSIVADKLDAEIEAAFLATKGNDKIIVRIWQPGSDNSEELRHIEDTIASLREDRELGMYRSAEDQTRFRSQMTALLDRRDALKDKPIVKAGWIEMESKETYADVWKTSDLASKRQMVIDAGIAYYVTREGQVIGDDGELITVKPGAFSTL